MTHEFTIKGMSTAYFQVAFACLEQYGSWLKEQSDDQVICDTNKDHSIALELYFLLEPKVSKKVTAKSNKEQLRANKRLKLKVHQGIILLDAIHYCWGARNFRHTPAMEHIKNQICKAIL